MTQQSLFRPGSGNREVATVQERLLARVDDPETSRDAAAKVVESGQMDTSRGKFLALLAAHPAGLTCNEAGALLPPRTGNTTWATEFNKRVAVWEHWGEIVCVGERDGARVWGVR